MADPSDLGRIRPKKKRKQFQHLVPVYNSPALRCKESHGMKYYILDEEPKEYVCERGCVHILIPSEKRKALLRKDSPIRSSQRLSYHMFRSPIKPIASVSSRLLPLEKPLHSMKRSASPIPRKQKSEQISRNWSDKRLTSPAEEKKYDRSEVVWNRLYPYKSSVELENVRSVERGRLREKPSKMDWLRYHRLDVIYGFLEELENQFPSLCTVGTIGQSLEGRDLKILKISNGNARNSAIWMDAGIHAREWIGPAVNTYIANYIARNFENLPSSCTNMDWYFMPVVNPDGYEYTHTKNRMWRKNRAWHNGKCVGVDLNRNFGFGWGGKGSSDDPNNCFYRGNEPFSEPESFALKSVLMEAKLPFKVYITLHSFGEVIIFPFACSDHLCPDYVRLLHGATVMSRAIYETNGTTYKVGISKDVMYRASGTSNDWCYGAVGIPYCYLIELRSKRHRFKLPHEEIEETGSEILNCIKALMDFVEKYPIEKRDKGDFAPYKWWFKVASKRGILSTQVWELRLIREGQRQFVKTLDTVGAINIWKEEHSTMDVMVDDRRSAQIAGMLHEREIPYSIAIPDVSLMLEMEQGGCISKQVRRNSSHYRQITMDWESYHRLETIYAFMENLAREYPYLVTLYTLGTSVDGRKIIMMKISNGNTGNFGVWLDAAIHPREWISTAVVTYIANKIVRNFRDFPESVTNKDWYVLPVINPDGYEYTHTHDRMWRKNRAHYGECIGVDLNRNFSYGWGQNGEEGSSEDPGNIFYRGPEPFSEPETKAIKNAILSSDTTFKVFLSLHSYGEVIIFPWGYTSDACPSYVELLEGGTAMAKAIYENSGHTYRVGSTKDLMYYAAGTSIDWSYAEAKIPFSYMLELRGKQHRFLLPQNQIVPTAKEVLSGILRLMDFVDKRCKGTQSCICRK